MTVDFRTLGLPERARDLARLISDYDPELSLERLPDNHPWLLANPTRPYAIVHRSIKFGEYVVDSYPESLLDSRIMGTIIMGDARKHGWDANTFDADRMAAMLLEERKRESAAEEKADRFRFAQGKGRNLLS